MENNGLDGYKSIFELSLEEINKFYYNNDDLENILKEKMNEKNLIIGENEEREIECN